jgi:hypothetical protein
VARVPYGQGVYLEPDARSNTFSPEQRRAFRWLDLGVSGFAALNAERVLTQELEATLFLPKVSLHASWEHFYELMFDGKTDHLDIIAGHLGFNMLGPVAKSAELHLLLGASGMRGKVWTPAFDVGIDARFYPLKPLAIRSSAIVSVFPIGPALLDARAQLGVSIGRFDIVAGPRVLYQGRAQGFWGPSAAVVVRF